MAPAVIDLTSSPEPDESPGKAAKSTLQHFQPRKQKAKPLSQFNDDEASPRRAARTALAGFQPRKQKERTSINGSKAAASFVGLQPQSLGNNSAGSETVRPYRQTVLENGYERPAYPTVLSHAHSNSEQKHVNGAVRSPVGQQRRVEYRQSATVKPISIDDDPAEGVHSSHDPNAQHTKNASFEACRKHQPPAATVRSAFTSSTYVTGGSNGVITIEDDSSSSDSSNVPESERSGKLGEEVYEELRPFKRRRVDDPNGSTSRPLLVPAIERGTTKSQSARSVPGEKLPIKPLRSLQERQRLLNLQRAGSSGSTKSVSSLDNEQSSGEPPDDSLGASRRTSISETAPRHTSLRSIRELQISRPSTGENDDLLETTCPVRKSLRAGARSSSLRESDRPDGELTNRHRAPYTAEEEALLTRLKEVDRLTYKQMVPYFTGRTRKSLEGWYHTKVKKKGTQADQVSSTLPQRSIAVSKYGETFASEEHESELKAGFLHPDETQEILNLQNGTTSNHGEPYSPEEDALLARLKEVDNLSWEEIVPRFNGRSRGSLQTR